MFAWGVENELVPPTVYGALQTVKGLRAGRSEARESEPVKPVPDGHLEKSLAHMSPVVADMVRLQLLTGCRPGEVCSLRPCDVTVGTDGVWTYRPVRHKTQHRGKERRIFIGPQGQEILRRIWNASQSGSVSVRPKLKSSGTRNEGGTAKAR